MGVCQVAQPIYKLWQARFNEAWYQLSEDEQRRLFASVSEALGAVGGKELVVCSASWADEQWPFFGLEEFPDLDAVQRHQQLLEDLRWERFMQSRSSLGTELVLPS